MLDRAAFVIALVVDRGDDRGLAIVPAVYGDAGFVADRGACAIGGNEEPGRQPAAVSKVHANSLAGVATVGLLRLVRKAGLAGEPTPIRTSRRHPHPFSGW